MVKLKKLETASLFRKAAMGTWKTAKDPSVYGLTEIDVTDFLPMLKAYGEKHKRRVTLTHFVGKALAYCMKRTPEINGMIRGSRIYLRQSVSLFFQVNIPGPEGEETSRSNLAGATIHQVDNISLVALAEQLADRAEKIRAGRDGETNKNYGLIKWLPWWSMEFFLDFTSWLMYGLNLNLSWLGISKDPFGSAMITNVGSLGIDYAWAPLCPYTRVPLLLTIGAISEKALVISGEIKARKVLPIAITFDHRFMDGAHAARMSRDFKNCFADPNKIFTELESSN